MKLSELQDLWDKDDEQSLFILGDLSDYSEVEDKCLYKNLVSLPINYISSAIDRTLETIQILDDSGIPLGELLLISGKQANVSSMGDSEYSAYINEVPALFFGLPYYFKKDYFVIDNSRITEYKNEYLETSPIWGGFLHQDSITVLPIPNCLSSPVINAKANIIFPTIYHQESLARSIILPYAFERYLKQYHMLELLFDWDIIQQIKGLGDDLKGIGQILSDYQSTKESQLLHLIIRNHHTDVSKLVNLLNKISVNPLSTPPDYIINKGITVFFDYSKNTNPLKLDKFNEIIANDPITPFCSQNLRNTMGLKTPETYENFIILFVSYCIYRIRCSIAHNRIGEYVMTLNDEKFLVEFGEPLIREVIMQAFQK